MPFKQHLAIWQCIIFTIVDYSSGAQQELTCHVRCPAFQMLNIYQKHGVTTSQLLWVLLVRQIEGEGEGAREPSHEEPVNFFVKGSQVTLYTSSVCVWLIIELSNPWGRSAKRSNNITNAQHKYEPANQRYCVQICFWDVIVE